MAGNIEIVWHGPAIEGRVAVQAEKALMQAAEHLLEEANRTVPLLEGTLMRSGSADADQHGATVSYGTPYARRQHEHLEYRHPDGRRAKWLEMAFQERARYVERWMGEQLRAAFIG